MKTKIFSILAIVLAISFLTSCMKKPVACMDASATTITAGQTITFTSCSTDAHHVEWDFGDGATAMGESVTHTYNNAGTYSVMITAMSENGKHDDMMMMDITVN